MGVRKTLKSIPFNSMGVFFYVDILTILLQHMDFVHFNNNF